MNLWDILILLAPALVVVLALAHMRRARARGGCHGCGDCGSCAGCAKHQPPDETPQHKE